MSKKTGLPDLNSLKSINFDLYYRKKVRTGPVISGITAFIKGIKTIKSNDPV